MQPPPLRITDETLERALAEMQRAGAAYGYVVAGSDYRGVVTAAGLRSLGESGGAHSIAEALQRGPTVAPGATLAEALPAALSSDYPLPVVDDDGHLQGVILPSALGEVLARDEKDGQADAKAN
jgi:glycine betaine/proline transport system ATP-binding protein